MGNVNKGLDVFKKDRLKPQDYVEYELYILIRDIEIAALQWLC